MRYRGKSLESSHDKQVRQGDAEAMTPGLDLPPNSAADPATSPGLRAASGGGTAFELKFELSLAEACRMKAWAARHLRADPHGGADGAYRITSVYCDTPEFDVFHRSPGYGRSKLRLRRYGSAPFVFLERKIRRGDEVRKRRVEVDPGDLPRLSESLDAARPQPDWEANWFLQHALKKRVAPNCRVGYRRTAFFGLSGGQPVRLTIDENLVGVPARGWEAVPLQEGLELLPDRALLELKFQDVMPELFRGLLPELPLQSARLSKYRRCIRVCGLAQDRMSPPPA